MIKAAALDNKIFATTPKAGAGKALSLEPRAEKDSSPANDTSATSINNKSDFSSRSDFQSTLKNKIEGSSAPKDDKLIDTRERSEDDDQPVTLADSDTMAPQMPALAPNMAAPKHIKSFDAAAAPQAQAMEHRLAWNSFLHTMKEKLGISAKDIMKAFKSLTTEELKAPPEQNIAKLVQSLGLNDQQAAMAQQMFKELIVRTDAQPLNKDSKLVLDASPLATMTKQEVQQQKTQASLQQMNQQFFMKNPPAAAAAVEKPEVQETETPKEAPVRAEGGFVVPPEIMKASKGAEQTPMEIPKMSAPQMKAQQAAQPKVEKASAKAAAFVLPEETPTMPAQQMSAASLVPTPKFTPKNISAPSTNFDPNSSVAQTVSQTPTAPIPVMPMAPTFGTAPDKNHDESGDENSNVMMEADDAVMPGHNGFAVGQNEVSGSAEMKKAMPAMGVPELVQQAHVMVKDGGGEMKVVLTPEGLGEVAMKVNVKDGKVNVEMITQTDEAKKVLENGFRALSEGLKAHHLNLESIQVNSANSLSTQLEQQYRDAQRHQAQQFLEQFHQDNQGWRQSYFDIPGAQTYRSQQNRASVGPQILSNPSANSRRLDLVA